MPLNPIPRTLPIRARRGTAHVHCRKAKTLTAAIEVEASTADGRLYATVPPFCPVDKLAGFLQDNAEELFRWHQAVLTDYEFRVGNAIPLFGEHYEIAESDGIGVRIVGDTIQVGSSPRFIRPTVMAFLKDRLRTYVRDRVRHYARVLGVEDKVTAVAVRCLAHKEAWGICYDSGLIQFDWILVGAPRQAIDAVACHEVAHLIHMHHGPAFWEQCRRGMPDYDDNHAMLAASQWGMLLKRLRRNGNP